MGSYLSRTMDDNLRKNQDFMIDMQRVQLERQIQMHNQMRERQMALIIAQKRELIYWLGPFYILAAITLVARYRKTKNGTNLVPLLPLSFVVGYNADFAYGSKISRIKSEAENIMEYEAQLLHLPNGVPTAQSIDNARQRQYEEQRIRKVHELYI